MFQKLFMYSEPFLSIDYYSKHACIVIQDNNSVSHEKLIYHVNIQCKYSIPIIYIDTAQVFNYMNTLLELKNKYVLITCCNDDISIPYMYDPPHSENIFHTMNIIFASPYLVKWYSKNAYMYHDKLQPLPLGPKWQWSSTKMFGEDKITHRDLFLLNCMQPEKNLLNKSLKKNLLYFNFSDTTCNNCYPFVRETEGMRQHVKTLFQSRFSWSNSEPFEKYIQTLSQYKFCLSPPGRGFDTHRTWEALMCGTIPIIKSSCMDKLFVNLPVIIVNDWNIITEEFLNEEYERIMKNANEKKYMFDICYTYYWDNEFKQYHKTDFSV